MDADAGQRDFHPHPLPYRSEVLFPVLLPFRLGHGGSDDPRTSQRDGFPTALRAPVAGSASHRGRPRYPNLDRRHTHHLRFVRISPASFPQTVPAIPDNCLHCLPFLIHFPRSSNRSGSEFPCMVCRSWFGISLADIPTIALSKRFISRDHQA